MTVEHVKSIVDSFRDTELFCQVAEHLEIPGEVLHVVRMGRMTATEESRWSSRHYGRRHCQAFGRQPQRHSSSSSTRAGCECIAHALQAMTDANHHATILSVDGISA